MVFVQMFQLSSMSRSSLFFLFSPFDIPKCDAIYWLLFPVTIWILTSGIVSFYLSIFLNNDLDKVGQPACSVEKLVSVV